MLKDAASRIVWHKTRWIYILKSNLMYSQRWRLWWGCAVTWHRYWIDGTIILQEPEKRRQEIYRNISTIHQDTCRHVSRDRKVLIRKCNVIIWVKRGTVLAFTLLKSNFRKDIQMGA